MQTWWSRTVSPQIHWLLFLLILGGSGTPILAAEAAEILLKNGTIIRGKLLVMNAMGDRAVGKEAMKVVVNAAPDPHIIARMDTGWQRIYFPVQQDSKRNVGLTGANPVKFDIKIKKQARTLTVTSFGALPVVEPFDEYGRRRVAMFVGNNNKPMNVVQAISEVAPDHVFVESLTVEWKLGLALKSIPTDSLEKLLQAHVDKSEPGSRLGLVRFYSQAEMFPQAMEELEAVAKDFADRKDVQEHVEKSRPELINYIGAEFLRRLNRRKKSGQHSLAQGFATELSTKQLGGAVQQDVQQYLRTYDQSRLAIQRAKLSLGEWQAKLKDREKETLVQPLRSEVTEQLDFETLPRLDSFLKAEADDQFEPSQRLGLAYSGWVLGAANAIPDLDQALRLWDARNTVLEYLRSDDPSLDIDLLKKLQSAENIGPESVLNLTAQLPPILDASEIEPGKPNQVEVAAEGNVNYWVTLPAEYSVHHTYPMVIVMRPRHRTAEQTMAAWAGDPNDADLGFSRGYIVISPDYAEKNAAEYSFGSPAHKFVLDCLVDARKRFSVDSDRVFLAGHGMGGDAAYDIGMAHPDEFAGVLGLGGSAINYCLYLTDNAPFTAWYGIGKGYDINGTRDTASDAVFDKMMRHGFKNDLMIVDYLGRNGENVIDEIPKLIDWMDLHVRKPMPKQFKMTSLRKADNRFFWVTALGLPRDNILPLPAGAARKALPMDIDVRITPGNTIFLKSPTENYALRLTPELIDFSREIIVKANDRPSVKRFVKPEIKPMLEELRNRGDRKRLPLAIITSST